MNGLDWLPETTGRFTAPDGTRGILQSEVVRDEGTWYFVEWEGTRSGRYDGDAPDWAVPFDLCACGRGARSTVISRLRQAWEATQ